jgi:hypothetical protein
LGSLEGAAEEDAEFEKASLGTHEEVAGRPFSPAGRMPGART